VKYFDLHLEERYVF